MVMRIKQRTLNHSETMGRLAQNNWMIEATSHRKSDGPYEQFSFSIPNPFPFVVLVVSIRR